MNIQSILASMFSLKGDARAAPPVQRLSVRDAYDKLRAGEITPGRAMRWFGRGLRGRRDGRD